MLELYDAKVYNIQRNSMTRSELLQFFLRGDGVNLDSKIALYEGEQLKGIVCYHDILYHRKIHEKLFFHSAHVFQDVLMYIRNVSCRIEDLKVEDGQCFPVLGTNEELLYILEYIERRPMGYKGVRTGKAYPVMSKYYNYTIEENLLDFELLDRADIYIMEVFNEYTYAITQVIMKYFKERKIYLLDKKGLYFWSKEEVRSNDKYEELTKCLLENNDLRTMFITKEERRMEREDLLKNSFPYESLFHSVFWKQRYKGKMYEKDQDEWSRSVQNAGLVAVLKEMYVYDQYKIGQRKRLLQKDFFLLYPDAILQKYFEISDIGSDGCFGDAYISTSTILH